MQLNERSLRNLEGVRPELVAVVKRAAEISPVPFVVTEGLRSQARQRELVKAGKSWTMDSRHLTGHAVDLVDANDFGYDIPDMTAIAKAMREAAAELEVKLVWGGDWKQRDTPHFELDRKTYPASGVTIATKAKEVATNVAASKVVQVTTGAAVGVTATTSTGETPTATIPAPPDLSAISAWKVFGQTVADLGAWASAHPALTFGLGAWVVTIIFWNQIKAAWAEWRGA